MKAALKRAIDIKPMINILTLHFQFRFDQALILIMVLIDQFLKNFLKTSILLFKKGNKKYFNNFKINVKKM